VSSADKAAQILPSLENYDIRVLHAIEQGMIQHKVVPHKEVLRISGLNESEIYHRLSKLYKHELIYREQEPYLGYLMNYNAYDILALNALVKAGMLEYLGPSIGVGKEADVYEGVTPDDTKVAVKFHRIGRTSFRDTKRKREYLADHDHTSWLYQSRLAAETEYEALSLMHEAGVQTPNPIYQNRHTIIMQYIKGIELSEILVIENAEIFLMEILDNLKKAYEAGVIHSDISEYNILIDDKTEIWIIDWPQYITSHHPNADETLERDVKNITYFFDRKHNVDMTLEEAVEYVKN